MTSQPGFVSINLHRSKEGSHLINYIQWMSPEKAEGRTPLACVPKKVAAVRRFGQSSAASIACRCI
jgi:hypothetical protein